MEEVEWFEMTVIGGGPTGLFGAFYAGLRGMRTKIIDSARELGGQLSALYPEKLIFDVAGFPEVLAGELAKKLATQGMQYGAAICLGERVMGLSKVEGGYRIETDVGVHWSKAILIAVGAGSLGARRLELKEAEALEVRGVFYSVEGMTDVTGETVLVVGGGLSAVEGAMALKERGARVTLIHRRNQFRAHAEAVGRLRASGVTVMTFWEVEQLVLEGGVIRGVRIRNVQTGEVRVLQVRRVLVQIGFHTSLGALEGWGVEMERGGIRVNAQMETSLKGVFAAGDIAAYAGKLKLIATGFGEAATAVNYAKTQVDVNARAYPGHSSEMRAQPESFVNW